MCSITASRVRCSVAFPVRMMPECLMMLLVDSGHANSSMIAGTLPAEWGAFISMMDLEVFANKIQGRLPLHHTRKLWMCNSSCTVSVVCAGTLPPSWKSMPRLLNLEAHSNNLSGTILPRFSSAGLTSLGIHSQAVMQNRDMLSPKGSPGSMALLDIERIRFLTRSFAGRVVIYEAQYSVSPEQFIDRYAGSPSAVVSTQEGHR